MKLGEAIKILEDKVEVNNLILENSHGSDFEEFLEQENEAIKTVLEYFRNRIVGDENKND